jgi:UDP-N-acetylmuramyl pentapeptide phosphotransferase/UDP-N-acetylglucosamine-1-phosphate transferase
VNGAVVLTVALGLGVAGGALAWPMLAQVFAAPLFLRTNVRGAEVPVAVGIVLPVVLLAAGAALVLLDAGDLVQVPQGALAVSVLAAAGFGMLGLFDDLAGDRAAQGFRGHLSALRSGRLTTGAVKLFGGGALAVLVAAPTARERFWVLLADAALIALSANLANLFDRAPGRLAKVSLLAAVPIVVVAGIDPDLAGPAVVLGALLALLAPDLRERLMLGDTGANVLGATLALAVVLTTAPSTRVVVLVVVAALNLLSERVSFSRVIQQVGPLRWLDGIGRLPPTT